MSLAESLANILAGGLASLKVKVPGNDAYYAFLPPVAHDINLIGLSGTDEYLRPRTQAYQFNSKITVPVLRTQANMLDLLPFMSGVKMFSKITCINGQIIASNAATLGETGFGFLWKLIIDPSLDKDVRLEITQNRLMTAADRECILTSSGAPADGTPNPTDSLYPMRAANMVVSDIAASGIQKIQIGLTGTSYTDVWTKIENAQFTAELLSGKEDDYGRANGNGQIKIDLSCDAQQTAESELLQQDNLDMAALDVKPTFINGWVFTTANNMGLTSSYRIAGNVNDHNVLHIECHGSIPASLWTTAWSS